MVKSRYNELVAVRVLHEQGWAYEQRLAHVSYRAMRIAANAAPGAGGLGYDLSEHALKSLVGGYRARMADVLATDLDEHRERELADLDAQHRALAALVDPIDRNATLKAGQVEGFDGVDAIVAHAPELVVLRSDATVIGALAALRQIGESRRKLLGIDAPASLKVDVTQHDAVVDELNAMLARAGKTPIERQDNGRGN